MLPTLRLASLEVREAAVGEGEDNGLIEGEAALLEAPLSLRRVLQHLHCLVEPDHVLNPWVSHRLGGETNVDHQVRSALPNHPAHLANQAAKGCLLALGQRAVHGFAAVGRQDHVVDALDGVHLVDIDLAPLLQDVLPAEAEAPSLDSEVELDLHLIQCCVVGFSFPGAEEVVDVGDQDSQKFSALCQDKKGRLDGTHPPAVLP